MKLYVYDHCPYCVRAEMVAGYKNINAERVVLLNDDVDTCMRLINAKQVPILEFDDGTAMAESLDIVKKFDEMGDAQKILLKATEKQAAILEKIATVSSAIYNLLLPRDVKIGLPEFATPAAIDYFTKKKELIIKKTFAQAMSETDIHKLAVEEMLAALPLLPRHEDEKIGYDDVMIFPTLRNLTMVKDLKMPAFVKNYIDKVAELTAVELYYHKAV